MDIETQVKQTLKQSGLRKKDKILVAISGGKDSTTTAYLLKKFGYVIEGIFIDLCVDSYSKKCLKSVERFCKELNIKLHVYDVRKEIGKGMKYFWDKNKNLNHCAVCGVFKKWILNKEARRLKVDYIATGHNLDDGAETILLNICKGSPQLSSNIGIVTRNTSDKKFIPRIKPLYYLENKEVRKFAETNKISFVKRVCPYREDSYRVEIREFVNDLDKKEKLNILKNFERIEKKLRRSRGDITYCEVCGEPSKNKICKKCKLVK